MLLLDKLRDPHVLRATIGRLFLGTLLQTPEGRAHVLTQAAIAEGSDEGAIFEHLVKKVDDPELAKMVKKHAEDEERHAGMFFACADRQGVGRPHVPTHIQVLRILDQRIHFFDQQIETDDDIMEAYLVLQVIEERAIEQFGMVEPVMRRFDTKTADVLAEVAADEQRHLRYCRAISKRYASSEALRETRLRELREEEAHAFRDHQRAGLSYMLGKGLLPPAATLFWRAAVEILSRRDVLPYTSFHDSAEGAVAHAA